MLALFPHFGHSLFKRVQPNRPSPIIDASWVLNRIVLIAYLHVAAKRDFIVAKQGNGRSNRPVLLIAGRLTVFERLGLFRGKVLGRQISHQPAYDAARNARTA